MRVASTVLATARFAVAAAAPSCAPSATVGDAVFHGLHRDGVEAFLGIRYAQDTGGGNRFKPPVPFVSSGLLNATAPGPACPQALGTDSLPLYLGNITETSEDCLRLNVFRPNGTTERDRWPVMVYIHGGSFKAASKDDPVSQPGGMILQAIDDGHPVISVQINYRLGIFGFAQSATLKRQGFENAGLRDQRLALEWVQSHIAAFGGNASNVLIHGQSSGGLAVGMQMVAYGAAKPPPFHKAIGQSQILEGGITGTFTRDAMNDVVVYVGCDATPVDSSATLECLRNLSADDLFAAQDATASDANVGDIWLPVVDGDFLPAAPSVLIATGRFYNVTAMIGWCEDDTTYFIPDTVTTASATRSFFADYLPAFTRDDLDDLLQLYPESEFPPAYFSSSSSSSFSSSSSSSSSSNSLALAGEIRRAGRILRDILMVCQPVSFGLALAQAGNTVYLYNHNQTLLTPILATNYSQVGFGVPHTSEFAYMFGNLTHYDIYGFPFAPTPADAALLVRQSRSWTAFAAHGDPSVGPASLRGWREADFDDENYGVYVIGGPRAGYAGVGGVPGARDALRAQKLRERCGFLTSPDIVARTQY